MHPGSHGVPLPAPGLFLDAPGERAVEAGGEEVATGVAVARLLGKQVPPGFPGVRLGLAG
jgi:hypothetical protein